MYDRADIARVLDATDIVRVVGQSVQLRPKGREMVGLCPFHDDRNPSMYVSPAKQIYKCFVCGAAGDAARFMQHFHSMSFPESIEHLAQLAGIEIQQIDARSGNQSPDTSVRRADVLDANQHAQSFFTTLFTHAEHGAKARAIVQQRAISDEMVNTFGIGVSPDRWDGLATTVAQKQWNLEAFEQAGLVKPRQHEQGCYDTFRNRLMFPIGDQLGRIVAFGARKINEEDEPKYLNSPESPVFRKSATLYGLSQASATIRKDNRVIITEGYTDTIACHQAGFTGAVAALGTAFTSEHAAVLRRLCDRVVLLFDSDEAGSLAADRAVSVLFHEPIDVSIVTLSSVGDAKDPDELLRKPGGKDLFARAIEAGQDLLAFRFTRLRAELEHATPAKRAARIEDELSQLVELGFHDLSPVRKSVIMKGLPIATGLDSTTLREAFVRIKPTNRTRIYTSETMGKNGQDDPDAPDLDAELVGRVVDGKLYAHERALGVLLVQPELAREPDIEAMSAGCLQTLDVDRYDHPLLITIVTAARTLMDAGDAPSLANVLTALAASNAAQVAVQLAARIERETNDTPAAMRQMWADCIERMRLVEKAAYVEPKLASDGETKPQSQQETLADRLQRAKQRHAQNAADQTRLPRDAGPSR